MTSSVHPGPPPPAAIVIFGANGDLTKRLIVPALYNLAKTKLLPEKLALIGVDHNDKGVETWRDGLREFLAETLKKGKEPAEIDANCWKPIADSLSYVTGDFLDPATYQRLAAHLAERDKAGGFGGNVLFYLAVADRFFGPVVDELGKAGLAEEKQGYRRVIVEKPFGHDLEFCEGAE